MFGGLSLIKPDLLNIDHSLLSPNPAPVVAPSTLLFARRRFYPQIIPPQGIRRAPRPSLERTTDEEPHARTALPNGLWHRLRPDYDAGIVEVFVNVAACLLSHTGVTELLSLAGRTSQPEKYQEKWFLRTDEPPEIAELPSWVPYLGSWMVCPPYLEHPTERTLS